MKSDRTIQRHLRELRRDCIEGSSDPVEKRIAYAMETAITWARKKTVGWPGMAEEARLLARLLNQDLDRG